jgi:hypothetical protein
MQFVETWYATSLLPLYNVKIRQIYASKLSCFAFLLLKYLSMPQKRAFFC